jgi:ABC-type multidrug transport system ATPase subunit
MIITTILTPGAGKSTVINVLSQNAFYGQAYGSVTLNGVPMNDRIFKRYCYLVKQHDMNWHYLTARESLTFAAQLYHVLESCLPPPATTNNNKDDNNDEAPPLEEVISRLVNDVLRKMGLESCADTKCSRLSGGQQRRLSLATALLKKPAVLFLDEPTSGLDAASATAIMHEITRVAKQERLVILCTIHQPSTKVYNDFDQGMFVLCCGVLCRCCT